MKHSRPSSIAPVLSLTQTLVFLCVQLILTMLCLSSLANSWLMRPNEHGQTSLITQSVHVNCQISCMTKLSIYRICLFLEELCLWISQSKVSYVYDKPQGQLHRKKQGNCIFKVFIHILFDNSTELLSHGSNV